MVVCELEDAFAVQSVLFLLRGGLCAVRMVKGKEVEREVAEAVLWECSTRRDGRSATTGKRYQSGADLG